MPSFTAQAAKTLFHRLPCLLLRTRDSSGNSFTSNQKCHKCQGKGKGIVEKETIGIAPSQFYFAPLKADVYPAHSTPKKASFHILPKKMDLT
jgi:hypothetical protein